MKYSVRTAGKLRVFSRHRCNWCDDSAGRFASARRPTLGTALCSRLRRARVERVKRWSRRGDLNAPSVDYISTALSLSYTGLSWFGLVFCGRLPEKRWLDG